jgi:hypothetical protein
MFDAKLEEAYHLIKAGQKVRAEAVLRPILESEPENADAWWLLANAVPDPIEARQAVERVLYQRPDHARAQLMLHTLGGAPVEKQKRDSEGRKLSLRGLLAILGGLLLIAIVAAGGFVVAVTRPLWLSDPFNYGTFQHSIPVQGFIASGQSVRAESTDSRDHAWRFEGSAGQRVIIALDSLDSALDPVLYLYDPGGALIASNGNASGANARIEAQLSQSGTYTIVAGSSGSHGGRYQLSLDAEA